MAEQTFSPHEVGLKLAETIRTALAKHEANIAGLRAREQKLEKHELCPLCSGPDVNGMCPCFAQSLQKNVSTPGSAIPSNTGLGSMGGGGTQPMAMGEEGMEAAYKSAPQRLAMKKGMNGEGDGGAAGLQMKEKGLRKDQAGLSDVGSLSKKTPEGISEKTMHGLKDEYGHDKAGKAKAYATANAIASGTVNHKSEVEVKGINTTPHLNDAKPGLAKAAMPSSSASALAPKPAAPVTSVAQANKEMGGFKSIAASPTAMPGRGGPSLTPGAGRKPLSSMGRASHAVAGMIPNAKAEKNFGSARSPYGTGGAGHATQTNMQSSIKANLATTKSEKDPEAKTTVGRGLDDKPVPGSKLPDKASKEISADGSGGDIKAGKGLRKDAEIPAKKVGGKQPVGQGGGDAMKPTHPDVQAGLADVKGLSPKGQWGNKGLPALKSKLAATPLPSSDVDVSEFSPAGKTLGQRVAGTAAPARGNPGALNAAVGRGAQPAPAKRDALDQAVGRGAPVKQAYDAGAALKEDKQRGGVGFLNALISKFRPTPAMNTNVNPDGTPNTTPIVSKRVHGAMPLQRAEQNYGKPLMCALCKGAEHSGMC